MRYPRVGHFWRNPVVLSFVAVMATAATITFAWRDTKSPGDLVELAEASVGKARATAGPSTTASKWLYAVRDAAGVPVTQSTATELESVVALGGPAASLGGGSAAGASANRFGFSGTGGSTFRPQSTRTSSGGGGASGGGFGGGGWGGVSGTAAATPAAAKTPTVRPERPAREPRAPRPERSSSSSARSGSGGGGSSSSSTSSGSEVVSAVASTPAVTNTFGTPAGAVVSAVAGGARGKDVAAVAGAGTVKPTAVSPTPEPMSLIMIGTGLAGAFGLRRRLKQ
jgi:hypothetical protein